VIFFKSMGVFGLSANKIYPQLLAEPGTALIYLAPDGDKIAWHDYSKEPEELVILELDTRQELSYPWQDSWSFVRGWAEDGRVKINVSGGWELGEGIFVNYAYFDIQTQAVQTAIYTLELPGFDYMQGPTGGSASVDPTGQVVLYSAFGKEKWSAVVLRDIQTGNELWRYDDIQVPPFPHPDWKTDGSQIVFALWLNEEGFMKILSLSRDGQQLEELTNQPLESLPYATVRDLEWSPDGRYLYYAMMRSTSEGPAFILDTMTNTIREICTPGYAFLNGQWLPDSHQFVYTVRRGEYLQEAGVQELGILDVDSWTAQILAVSANENATINILGWTPLEWP
jgi:hypothetical protein